MALLKAIKQKNGIILSYHRIKDIKNVINGNTLIEVCSYVDQEEREKEKTRTEFDSIFDIYIANSTETHPYDDTLTVEQAYEYLKTLDKYKDAKDI